MASIQSTDFTKYSGQLVANGIATNMPLVNLEEGTKATNIASMGGLSAKIKDVFIRDTRVFNNPLDRYWTKWYQRFGAGMEQAMFSAGVNRKVSDTACMPWGNAPISSQTNWVNFAYDCPITIYDHEVDGAVMDEGMLGAYTAAKLKTPLARIAQVKYRAQVQLISDVIDGTRNIAGNSASDNSGASVTYNPTVTGYAGSVIQSGVLVPAVARGQLVSAPDTADILNIAQTLQGYAADFDIPATDGNKAGADTFTTSKPLCIMETKTLNAFDAAFVNSEAASSTSVYGYSFRNFIDTFAERVEIDSFADLPTNSTYTNQRLGAVLIDRDSLIENVKWADVESFRCTENRATGYSYQGASILSIANMLNSAAMTFKTQA